MERNTGAPLPSVLAELPASNQFSLANHASESSCPWTLLSSDELPELLSCEAEPNLLHHVLPGLQAQTEWMTDDLLGLCSHSNLNIQYVNPLPCM